MYQQPDLTGTNALYKVEDRIYSAVRTYQKINLDGVAYADTLELRVALNNTVLARDVDWTIEVDDYADDAMSVAKNINIEFNRILVKSVTLQKPVIDLLKIRMSYQGFYPVEAKWLMNQGQTGVMEITPATIYNLLQDVHYLKTITSSIQSAQAPNEIDAKLLEEDIGMSKPENFIEKERHDINVPGNISIIRPIAGAFFEGTEVVKNVLLGEVLQPGIDYVCFGTDLARTSIATVTNAVMNYILIKSPIVGEIDIDYHAFGGEVTLYDGHALRKAIMDIAYHLNSTHYMTPDTLGSTPTMHELRTKVAILEENMRILANASRATYDDATHGATLLKKVSSPNSKFHWWTIAELYKVNKENNDDGEIFTYGTFKCRVTLAETQLKFDAIVTVDLDNDDPLVVDVQSSMRPKHYVPYDNYDQVGYIVRPQFRIIYNDSAIKESGAYLQIGFALKAATVETMVVEDFSGLQSAWKMASSPVSTTAPEDDMITLPSGEHVWSSSNPLSVEVQQLIPLTDGHLIYAGGRQINETSGYNTQNLPHLLEKDNDVVDLTDVKKIRIELAEVGGRIYTFETPVVYTEEQGCVAAYSFHYNNMPAIIQVVMQRDPLEADALKLILNSEVTAGAASNQLNLQHIFLYT